MSEQESLKIITEMINKAKPDFHSSGTSAILWGTTIAFCGFISFAERFWNFTIGFDIWWLTFIALIPQIIISGRERKKRKAITHIEAALNAVWIVYAISIFTLILYLNIVPSVFEKSISTQGSKIMELTSTGASIPFHIFIPSYGSLFLLLYAIPTLATGLICKFRPMVFAAILCYIFFFISCFTSSTYDLLLNGMAGVFNWLIPGIILKNRYSKLKRTGNV